MIKQTTTVDWGQILGWALLRKHSLFKLATCEQIHTGRLPNHKILYQIPSSEWGEGTKRGCLLCSLAARLCDGVEAYHTEEVVETPARRYPVTYQQVTGAVRHDQPIILRPNSRSRSRSRPRSDPLFLSTPRSSSQPHLPEVFKHFALTIELFAFDAQKVGFVLVEIPSSFPVLTASIS